MVQTRGQEAKAADSPAAPPAPPPPAPTANPVPGNPAPAETGAEGEEEAKPKEASSEKASPKKTTPKPTTSKKATPKKTSPKKVTPKKTPPKKPTPNKAPRKIANSTDPSSATTPPDPSPEADTPTDTNDTSPPNENGGTTEGDPKAPTTEQGRGKRTTTKTAKALSNEVEDPKIDNPPESEKKFPGRVEAEGGKPIPKTTAEKAADIFKGQKKKEPRGGRLPRKTVKGTETKSPPSDKKTLPKAAHNEDTEHAAKADPEKEADPPEQPPKEKPKRGRPRKVLESTETADPPKGAKKTPEATQKKGKKRALEAEAEEEADNPEQPPKKKPKRGRPPKLSDGKFRAASIEDGTDDGDPSDDELDKKKGKAPPKPNGKGKRKRPSSDPEPDGDDGPAQEPPKKKAKGRILKKPKAPAKPNGKRKRRSSSSDNDNGEDPTTPPPRKKNNRRTPLVVNPRIVLPPDDLTDSEATDQSPNYKANYAAYRERMMKEQLSRAVKSRVNKKIDNGVDQLSPVKIKGLTADEQLMIKRMEKPLPDNLNRNRPRKSSPVSDNDIGLNDGETFNPRLPGEKRKKGKKDVDSDRDKLSVWERLTIKHLTERLLVNDDVLAPRRRTIPTRFEEAQLTDSGCGITEIGPEDSEAQLPTLTNDIHPIWASRNFTFSKGSLGNHRAYNRRAYEAITPALRLASYWIEEPEFQDFWNLVSTAELDFRRRAGTVKLRARSGPKTVRSDSKSSVGDSVQDAEDMMQKLAESESLEWKFARTEVKYVGLSKTVGQVSTLHYWYEKEVLYPNNPHWEAEMPTSRQLRLQFLLAVNLCRQLVQQIYHHLWTREHGDMPPPRFSKVVFESAPDTSDYLEVAWDTFMFTGLVVKIHPNPQAEGERPNEQPLLISKARFNSTSGSSDVDIRRLRLMRRNHPQDTEASSTAGLAIALGRRAAEWVGSTPPKAFAAMRMRWIGSLFQDSFWSDRSDQEGEESFRRLPDRHAPLCAVGPFTHERHELEKMIDYQSDDSES